MPPVLDKAPAAEDPTIPLRVELGDRSYQIHLGPEALANAGRLIEAAAAPSSAFIITHPIIDRLHGDVLRRGLRGFSFEIIHVPAGERQKTLRRAAWLYDRLLELGADRSSAIIAFGGGVIGDLAGFVAATYMRGVPYLQIPTTLLAQVDASVGGKVAVDHPKAKNLIGAFYQPRLVLADSGVLRTLPAREYRSGLAEVVKHAVALDQALFLWLQQNAAALASRHPSAIAHAVRRSCEIKAEVVRRDERETGPRAILNLGHTVGHALETLAGYRSLRHGEAVAIGMVAAARIAVSTGRLAPAVAAEIESLLHRFRLPVRSPAFRVDDIIASLRADKKTLVGVPRFVLPRAIGDVESGVEVPEHTVADVLLSLGAAR
jgi:3-dehydroquinate synthase